MFSSKKLMMVSGSSSETTPREWFSYDMMAGSASLEASGVLSEDGNSMAVTNGNVSIYNRNGSLWQKRGQSLLGSGASLTSDGLTVLVGNVGDNIGAGQFSGSATVYFWDGSSWVQKGSKKGGSSFQSLFGEGLDISADGSTIAVGETASDGAGINAGVCKIYRWSGSDWDLTGQIHGSFEYEGLGWRVALNDDGSVLAISNKICRGRLGAYTYVWNGSQWSLSGNVYGEPEDPSSEHISKYSLDLSGDGRFLVVGCPQSSQVAPTFAPGYVRVFERVGSSWVRVGGVVYGASNKDLFGTSVAINSSGTSFVAGAPWHGGNSRNYGGAFVYDLANSGWLMTRTEVAGSGSMIGSGSEDRAGSVVSMSGDGNTVTMSRQEGRLRIFRWLPAN